LNDIVEFLFNRSKTRILQYKKKWGLQEFIAMVNRTLTKF